MEEIGLLCRYLYTEELSSTLMGEDIVVAFEAMRCAGKYGLPYLYIQCRQWIIQHLVEHFNSKRNVKTDALSYLQLVNANLSSYLL